MSLTRNVHELRGVLVAEDLTRALHLYRDVLGLPVVQSLDDQPGGGAILDAGRGTLEVVSPAHADFVDGIEVGQSLPPPLRLAFQVDDSTRTAGALVLAGADRLGGPVTTPWRDRNVRLRAPDGMHLTLFTVPEADSN